MDGQLETAKLNRMKIIMKISRMGDSLVNNKVEGKRNFRFSNLDI